MKARVTTNPRSYLVLRSERVVQRTSAHLRHSQIGVGAHQDGDNGDILLDSFVNEESDSNRSLQTGSNLVNIAKVGQNVEVRNNVEEMAVSGTDRGVARSGRIVKIPKKLSE